MPRAAVIEPFAHFAPTGEGWAEGLEENGWTVERYGPPYGMPLDADLIIIMDVPGGLLDGFQHVSCAKLVAVVSDKPHFDIAPRSTSVDFFVSHTLRHDALDAQFAAAGAKLHHLPLAGRRMFAQPLPAVHFGFYEYDLAFVGSYWHGNRDQTLYLGPFLANGHSVYLAGCEGRAPVPYQILPSIYARTKVGLNFHYPYQKEESRQELNARTFDLALAGCFQVTDNPATAPLLGGVAVADASNWQETVKHYLAEPTLRANMASVARREALERHTWGARMAQFLEMAGLS